MSASNSSGRPKGPESNGNGTATSSSTGGGRRKATAADEDDVGRHLRPRRAPRRNGTSER